MLATILAITGLIAVGLVMLGIAWVITHYLERRTGEKLRPKLPSYDGYGDGLTAADIERLHNGSV